MKFIVMAKNFKRLKIHTKFEFRLETSGFESQDKIISDCAIEKIKFSFKVIKYKFKIRALVL